ncbi:MAG: dTDP-4-dehydrorhamnose reductase [Alphaproteobacteria bacterium]|jgi:dTDP-4-dehydrorhamnose reductase|nr:dTDP-4-dehydrorhamnose reductase [Alphaproteobacteria bacterium]
MEEKAAITVLVTGAAGQLGRALCDSAWPGLAVTGVTRADCDLTDGDAVARLVATTAPDVVINAAAYTAVDKAESEPGRAFAVNRDGPGHLAAACARHGAALIHVSTDYVFDGSGDRPRREDDPTGPLGVYGASKLAGEEAVRARLPRHVILRTSWVYSATGGNFVKTMLRVGAERDRLTIVRDQQGCPTAADDLAGAAALVAGRLAAAPETAPTGTFHYSGTGTTTWFDFAVEIFRQAAAYGRPVPELVPITTADYPTPARRPANSVLDCARIAAAYGVARPPWPESLRPVIAALCRI